MPGFGDPCPDDDEVPLSDNEDDADSCEDDADWDDENDLENDVSFETQTHSQQTPDVQSRHFPISGRGFRHPVSSFNDTSAF